MLANAQSSTETYTYDPLGRLVRVAVTGGQGDGEQREITYDAAGNRTSYASTCTGSCAPTPTPSPTPTPTPTTCTLVAPASVITLDEGVSRVNISRGSPCTHDIVIDYSIVYLYGPGGFDDRGFLYEDNILTPSESLLQLYLGGCGERCIPDGQTLNIRIDWVVTSPNSAISPTSTFVTFEDTW
ncbi:MAG: hypothetical protein U0975_08355 [Erythrobacter sp.]|nr:hypothetical protein [Erythrobacter sp.]MDZ4272668.1 hypothetical protein [Erythrobacter sp.]